MNTTMKALTVSLLACAGLSTSAIAQDAAKKERTDDRRELKGDFNKPLTKRADGQSSVTMMMSQSDGDNQTTVRVENGKVTAELNGKKVPQDRIRQEGGKIEILGENGEVVTTFNMNFGGGNLDVFRMDGPDGARMGNRRGFVLKGPDGKPQELRLDGKARAGVGGPAPKVMIGINMSDADPRLMEHLGLGERGGVLVDTVVEGLPAQKAGLQEHDLIVSVDGKSPINQEQLREVLRAKNPGDELHVKIVRKGSPEKDVTIRLDAFDAGKLGIAGPGGAGDDAIFEMHAIPDVDVEIQRNLEEAMKQLHGEGGRLNADVQKHIEEAMKQLKERNFEWRGGDGGVQRFRLFDDKGGHWIVPGEGAAPDADRVTEQLDRLSSQLEKLNERLERLEKRLNDSKR